MSSVCNIVQVISQANKVYQNVYFNVEDPNFQGTNDATSQARTINSLLSEAKSRPIGLRFLIEYCNHCTQKVIEERANFWITIIIRSCNTTEISLYGELIFEALGLLVTKIQAIPEVSKWFGSTYLQKFYEFLSVKQKTTRCTFAILKTLEQCLKYYPGPSKSGKPLITNYLITLLDSRDKDVVYASGCCWLQLQQVRDHANNARSFNDKTQWNEFQNSLLSNLNTLLNDAYPHYENISSDPNENHKFKCFAITLEGDPVIRAAQVSQRFCNLIDYLQVALSMPYPSAKQIEPKKILNLIHRGLSLTVDDMCFSHFLPNMHIKLLDLLEVLINICSTHLRMHFRFISDLLLETFKITKRLSRDGSSIDLINLRSKLYKVTTLWISTFGEGIGNGFIVETVVKNIFEDVLIPRTDIYLMSMGKTRDLTAGRKEILLNNSKSSVCTQAFLCLQTILTSVGYLIKSSLLKDIFNTVLEIGVEILQKQKLIQNPYNDWQCRLGLYKTLFAFISTRNFPYNPPSEIILYILEESRKSDPSFEICTSLRVMIDSIENTLHPQKDSLIFERVPDIIERTSLIEDSSQLEHNNTNFDNTELKENTDISEDVEMSAPSYSARVEVPSTYIEGNTFSKILKNNEKIPITINEFDHKESIEKSELLIPGENVSHITSNKPYLKQDVKSSKGMITDSRELSNQVANSTTEVKNTEDDEYVAELEAAFVYELK